VGWYTRRYVEEYKTEDVELELGLTQERMGELALLLGSDYTEVRSEHKRRGMYTGVRRLRQA